MDKNINKYVVYGLCLTIVILTIVTVARWTNQDSGISPEVLVENVPYDVKMYIEPREPAVGDTIYGRVEIRRAGKLVDLESDYIFPHTSVVSNNAADIYFYHDDDQFIKTATGTYTFRHTLTEPTNYTLWIEMNNNQSRQHHGEHSDYVGRIALPVTGADAEPPVAEEQSSYVSDEYTINLLNDTVVAGQPEQLRLQVETQDGEPVLLMEDFDHYYVVASPQKSFYILDHPDHAKSTSSEIMTTPISFPSAGQYAFWIRIVTAHEDNTAKDWLTGKFVVNVTE